MICSWEAMWRVYLEILDWTLISWNALRSALWALWSATCWLGTRPDLTWIPLPGAPEIVTFFPHLLMEESRELVPTKRGKTTLVNSVYRLFLGNTISSLSSHGRGWFLFYTKFHKGVSESPLSSHQSLLIPQNSLHSTSLPVFPRLSWCKIVHTAE